MFRERTTIILSTLCYLPFASVVVCLVTLLRYPHSSFAMYHVRQGFSLFILWVLSLVFASVYLLPGLILWAIILFFSLKIAYGTFLGERRVFPGLQSLTRMMPIEFIYAHLTGTHFPQQF